MAQAYACRIKRSNYDAILSEKPNFNLEELQSWLDANEDGYFIRDEDAPWDCTYMNLDIFGQVYRFEQFRPNDIFHRISMTPKENK